ERLPIHTRRSALTSTQLVGMLENVCSVHLVEQLIEPEVWLTLGLDVELPLKVPDLFWSYQASGQSPSPLPSSEAFQKQGPFPPPKLPGLHGTMGPSDSRT